jgi:competence protein ComEA
MMSRGSRFAIWCLALLLSITLCLKGRVFTEKGEGAALSRSPSGPGTVTVRLAGELPRPGVYRFPDGTTAVTAIKMTVPSVYISATSASVCRLPLASGDMVTLALSGGKAPLLSLGKMATRERMLLGIPLNPDVMEAADWDCLPGIGPALSARIVEDRHENGAFGSVEGLGRVPGIGPGRLSAIRRYFPTR